MTGGEGRPWTRDKHTTVLQLPRNERRGLVVVPIFDVLFRWLIFIFVLEALWNKRIAYNQNVISSVVSVVTLLHSYKMNSVLINVTFARWQICFPSGRVGEKNVWIVVTTCCVFNDDVNWRFLFAVKIDCRDSSCDSKSAEEFARAGGGITTTLTLTFATLCH